MALQARGAFHLIFFFNLIHFIQVYFLIDHEPLHNFTTALQSVNNS